MFWYNGKLIHSENLELKIDDPGLLYGATVFTTLRVYHNSLDSSLTNYKGHCDRLFTSLQTFNWILPDWQRLRLGAETLAQNFPVLRIAIFPDGREWIVGRNLPDDLTEKQKDGIEAIVVAGEQFDRCLPAHKTGNYLSAWMARNAAQQLGVGEAILASTSGNWLETSTGNLWGWRDGCWWTPRLDAGILPGLVRNCLIAWLKSQNQEIKEEPWTSDAVKDFEAIAYSNSGVEVIPIHTVITGTSLKYDPHHPRFQQLRQFFLHDTTILS